MGPARLGPMASPPMLQPREPSGVRVPAEERPDPVISLVVLLICVCIVALALGAVLAVYDWTTPGAMRPLFFTALGVFCAAVAVLVGSAGVRHLRTLRTGTI